MQVFHSEDWNVDYDKDSWESCNQLEPISEQTQNEGQIERERALETSSLDTVWLDDHLLSPSPALVVDWVFPWRLGRQHQICSNTATRESSLDGVCLSVSGSSVRLSSSQPYVSSWSYTVSSPSMAPFVQQSVRLWVGPSGVGQLVGLVCAVRPSVRGSCPWVRVSKVGPSVCLQWLEEWSRCSGPLQPVSALTKGH